MIMDNNIVLSAPNLMSAGLSYPYHRKEMIIMRHDTGAGED